jgi:putative transcriptional regulator
MPGNSIYLTGQLLLDNGSLRGSFFQRTVVLICQHDAEGAFGLVLNRATGGSVGDLVVADLPERIKGLPMFLGGPVQPSAMSYLHSDVLMAESNVIPNLFVGHELDALIQIGETFAPAQKAKVFAGYSGWGAGQLEDEMKRNSWVTHPASLDLIFDPHPETLWQRILRKKSWRYQILAEAPEDLSWN